MLGKTSNKSPTAPGFNSEPNEYYGGKELSSRSRTYSNVSSSSCADSASQADAMRSVLLGRRNRVWEAKTDNDG